MQQSKGQPSTLCKDTMETSVNAYRTYVFVVIAQDTTKLDGSPLGAL